MTVNVDEESYIVARYVNHYTLWNGVKWITDGLLDFGFDIWQLVDIFHQ